MNFLSFTSATGQADEGQEHDEKDLGGIDLRDPKCLTAPSGKDRGRGTGNVLDIQPGAELLR